jgi:hypothetical protein
MGKKLVKPLAASAKSTKAAKAIAAARPIDALFSKSRQRVLAVLFGNPQRSFYANEIIALAQVGTGSTQRELSSLADAGLLLVSKQGNQKHFQANPDSVLAAEIYALVRKTLSLAGVLGAALAPLAGRIDFALVHGSADHLRDTAHNDVSVLVSSDSLTDDDLAAALVPAATTLARRFAVTLCTPAELADAIAQDAGYLASLQAQSKLWLIGTQAQIAADAAAASQL